MKVFHNPRWPWAPILIGMALAALPAQTLAQIALGTVVDLAQRNSGAVRLAEADLQKAQAALAATSGEVKPAVLLSLGARDCDDAVNRLRRSHDRLDEALDILRRELGRRAAG